METCLLFTELGYVPWFSGFIKVISWALLALEILFSFVFGWDGVRRFYCIDEV